MTLQQVINQRWMLFHSACILRLPSIVKSAKQCVLDTFAAFVTDGSIDEVPIYIHVPEKGETMYHAKIATSGKKSTYFQEICTISCCDSFRETAVKYYRAETDEEREKVLLEEAEKIIVTAENISLDLVQQWEK